MGYKKCQRISLLLKPHPISLKNVSWTWSQKVWYVRPPPSPIVNFQLPWWFLVMAFETNGLSLWSGCESSTMRPRRTRARSSSKGRSSSQAFFPRYASSLNPRWCIARLRDFRLPGNPGCQGTPAAASKASRRDLMVEKWVGIEWKCTPMEKIFGQWMGVKICDVIGATIIFEAQRLSVLFISY